MKTEQSGLQLVFRKLKQWAMVGSLGLALFCAVPARGGGTILFANRSIIYGINAPITGLADGGGLMGPDFVAQLFVLRDWVLEPIGVPVPFSDYAFLAGYVNGGSVEVPFAEPGEFVQVVLRAWNVAAGREWKRASSSWRLIAGQTEPVWVWLGGAPGQGPGPLFGLSGAQIGNLQNSYPSWGQVAGVLRRDQWSGELALRWYAGASDWEYAILLRSETLDGDYVPVDLQTLAPDPEGQPATISFAVSNDGAPQGYYRLRAFTFSDDPADSDGDQIPDRWEIYNRHPGAALNGNDALEDHNGNGVDDLTDYRSSQG